MADSSTSRDSTLIPISNVLDVSRVGNLKADSPEFKSFLTSLAENLNSIMLSINSKDIGIYDDNETITGQSYFNDDSNEPRPGYRKRVVIGALGAIAGTTSVAHDLDSTWSYEFTRIYGVATDPIGKKSLPIPYASATAADIIELSVDSTNVNITVGKDRSAFTITYVVLEYLE